MDLTVNGIVLLFAMKVYVILSTDHVLAKMSRMDINTVMNVSDTVLWLINTFVLYSSDQSNH